ncbi:MAG: hypothetical protein MUE41_11450 [Gemmatimonadaceae bacterium]|nr:hypothetical protein [Gemmatimonadaceae bacterium]
MIPSVTLHPRIAAHALCVALLVSSRAYAAPVPEQCRLVPAPTVRAADALARAVQALGIAEIGPRIRAGTMTDIISMDYQSDRPYPPYLWTNRQQRLLIAPAAGLVRLDLSMGAPGFAVLSDSARQVVVSPRGAQAVPQRTPNLLDERAMDAWTVLGDWQRATDVRVLGRCVFRDAERVVLGRGAGVRMERLFLDPRTGVPVKLDRLEAHPLWGELRAEYLWQIWTPVTGVRALAPQYAFRMVEGEVNVQRLTERFALLPADSAAALAFPATIAPQRDAPAAMPDTVRVSPTTFLLRTPSYTNVVTLQRDTVFILDAQTDAARAQGDSAWIGRLFPGRHPVVLVVTDLAWPHIGGVRNWVAQGATVVSHEQSRAFLEKVTARQWQLEPDALTRARATRAVPLRFRGVSTETSRAAGGVRLVPIDGAGSEGALMVYLGAERFLWTGDFVQPGASESFSRVYAEEVVAAAARAALTPERYAGMHVGLTDWARVPRWVVPTAPAR